MSGYDSVNDDIALATCTITCIHSPHTLLSLHQKHCVNILPALGYILLIIAVFSHFRALPRSHYGVTTRYRDKSRSYRARLYRGTNDRVTSSQYMYCISYGQCLQLYMRPCD